MSLTIFSVLVASPDDDQSLIAALRAGDRRALAKAITLLESTLPAHRRRADALLDAVLPATGRSLRLGISGVPGVGKSTFIEALGMFLLGMGHRVAVLAVDPSSGISGGSILGDKTRMERLSVQPQAYIRPSPSSGTLGGVAEKTREALLVCEAAGYDIVIVETVGVGQSETTVAGMTDMFILLQLPNAGDDLQAMKKGIMELADLVVINKTDLDPDAALRAEAQITGALRVLRFTGAPSAQHSGWQTRVMRASALKSDGLDAFWDNVKEFKACREQSGEFAERRRKQALTWMWDQINTRLVADFRASAAIKAALPQVLQEVETLKVAPSSAARRLLDIFASQGT
ncbi:MAG: methylmalonyl Co-A mutase-associated GTPase MeaB [Steroidobacteraceae bacterium]|jgi:LAO/AO transport system kinase|nr:methylmalonyl Co-A mutase-associated GTPase MeaB [Gammaproteobacteria bacterium]